MYAYIKHAGDIFVASISIILLLALFFFVAVIIKIDSKGPILFKQQRYGSNRRPFTIYKFRTMAVEAPDNCATGDLNKASSYITRSGKILRKLSIDELPQLINVLKGEMSLIGPRPVILRETDLINEREKYNANKCLPGITGWAQANGRDEISLSEKARLDGEYADNIGLMMDIRCILKTIETLIYAKGYREGSPILVAPSVLPQGQVFYARVQSTTKISSRSIRRRPAVSEVVNTKNSLDI